MSATDAGSPRSPRAGRGNLEDDVEVLQPGTLKVSVRYAETGDSQVLYFPAATSTVEELGRQTVEYAEHGVNCKPGSMILLLDDGTSLTKGTSLLSTLSSLTVFMFGRETLLKTYSPTVALEDFRELDINGDSDAEMKRELCERCLGRCMVQIEAGQVALRNLIEHSKSVQRALTRFHATSHTSYLKKAELLVSFEQDLEKLALVPLARAINKVSSTTSDRKSMLDVLPKDKLRRSAEEASRQNDIIQQKYDELNVLARSIYEGCESVLRQWDAMSAESSAEAQRVEKALKNATEESLDDLVKSLKQLKAQTTKALFPTLVRTISTLQSRIQDLNNRLAALNEALVVQEQKLAHIGVIHSLPDAYQAGLREAERRREFVTAHHTKVTQLTDYVARERDKELERREQFNRQYGKVLPPELVPGLYPWVFPPCDVTQRPIDPLLFSNALETTTTTTSYGGSEPLIETTASSSKMDDGELLFEPGSASPEIELTAIEILELQAENELLRAGLSGGGKSDSSAAASSFLEKLKEQHLKEMESMRSRVAELEARLSASDTHHNNERAVEDARVSEPKPPVEMVSSPSNAGSASSPSNDESGTETPSVGSPASKQAPSEELTESADQTTAEQEQILDSEPTPALNPTQAEVGGAAQEEDGNESVLKDEVEAAIDVE